MILIGLTGSIGMGKSATAKMFAEEGIPVFDADAAVHRLYAEGGAAVSPLGKVFPEIVTDGAIDRQRLSQIVIKDPSALAKIEAIVHPLVRQAQEQALKSAQDMGAKMVVLDIPLLFEKRGRDGVDYVVVVSAPANVQRERVLSRPDMSVEKFETILKSQVPDQEKRKQADFVIETDKGFDAAREKVKEIIVTLLDVNTAERQANDLDSI